MKYLPDIRRCAVETKEDVYRALDDSSIKDEKLKSDLRNRLLVGSVPTGIAFEELLLANTYKKSAINWNSSIKNSNPRALAIEIAAGWIADRFDAYKNALESNATSRDVYNIKSHDGQSNNSEKSDQYEKHIALEMYNLHKKKNTKGFTVHGYEFGEIVNYEVPLSGKGENGLDDCRGDIDLVAVGNNASEKTLSLIELKRSRNNQETILRCILEVYTYAKTIKDITAFKEQFNCQNARLILCPLVFKGTNMYEELQYLLSVKSNQENGLTRLISCIEADEQLKAIVKFSWIDPAEEIDYSIRNWMDKEPVR